MLKSFFRIFMALHIFFYRLTSGKFGGKVQGLPVLLLTTRGRKTGKMRTIPLGYFKEDGGYVITASNAGFDTHPAWYHNLRSNPRATIEINDQRYEVRAEIAADGQRDQLWTRLITLAPGYANYEKRTSRKIPLVILRPG
jgi:deazaflavin-dependent oxidoreductase (nitroreductase family)